MTEAELEVARRRVRRIRNSSGIDETLPEQLSADLEFLLEYVEFLERRSVLIYPEEGRTQDRL